MNSGCNLGAGNIEEKMKEKTSLLYNWRNMAKNYSWLHRQSHQFFQQMNIFFMIPVILMSTAAGAINLMKVHDNRCNDDFVDRVSVALGVTGLGAAALSTLHNFMRLGERQESHNTYASEFEKLAREISVQALLTTTEEKTYANMAELLKETNDKINHLIELSPAIPDFIFKKLEKFQRDNERKIGHMQVQQMRSDDDLSSTGPGIKNANSISIPMNL